MCPTLDHLNKSMGFYTQQLTPQDNNNPALSEFAEMTGWTKTETEPTSVSVDYRWFPGNSGECWHSNTYYNKFDLLYCYDKVGSGNDSKYLVEGDESYYQIDWGRGYDKCKIIRPYKPNSNDCHVWNDSWYQYESILKHKGGGKSKDYVQYDNKFVVWPPNMKTIFNQAFDQSLLTNLQIDSDIKTWMEKLLEEYEYVKNHKSKN